MATNKEIDKTFLSLDHAEERGFIHRDYIAHCFRWSHVIKFMAQGQRYKGARVLDLGCGKEVPLLKTMYTSKMTPLEYTGLDYNQIDYSDCVTKALDKCSHSDLVSHYDVSEDVDNYINEDADVVVSFEVFEHMTPAKLLKLLTKMSLKLRGNADIFISTPNFNGGAAANHHNEMTQDFLTELFEAFGFIIQHKYGTFASQRDYLPELRKDGYENLFDRLCEYYDSNIVATIFAPLYPNFSRNVIWHMNSDSAFKMNEDKIKEVIRKYAAKQQDASGWAQAADYFML